MTASANSPVGTSYISHVLGSICDFDPGLYQIGVKPGERSTSSYVCGYAGARTLTMPLLNYKFFRCAEMLYGSRKVSRLLRTGVDLCFNDCKLMKFIHEAMNNKLGISENKKTENNLSFLQYLCI